jgi:hypothetical protein
MLKWQRQEASCSSTDAVSAHLESALRNLRKGAQATIDKINSDKATSAWTCFGPVEREREDAAAALTQSLPALRCIQAHAPLLSTMCGPMSNASHYQKWLWPCRSAHSQCRAAP